MKYHITKDGQVKPCRAKVKPCPLGGGHFDTPQLAEAYLEEKYTAISEYEMNVNLGGQYKTINANRRGLFVEKTVNQAKDDGLETHLTHYDVQTQTWSPERTRVHNEILDELMEKTKNVPNENKVVFSAGLSGAGKTTVLTQYENLDVNSWVTVSSDDFKEMLAERNMVPEIEGLTRMEASTLVHEESSYLADKYLSMLSDQGKNIIYDFTCKNVDSTIKRIDTLKDFGYETKDMQFVFVDIPINIAKERAKHRYFLGLNQGVENSRKNKTLGKENKISIMGGRYLPESIIDASKPTNSNLYSKNAETLIKLHTSDLGLPEPIVYNNAGSEPIKKSYIDFLIGQ